MFCKTCGKEINDNAVICPNCGCLVTEINIDSNKTEKGKLNTFCLVGFIISCISLFIAFWGIVAIAGGALSIVGILQASKKNEKLKGLGIAGVIVAGVSLIYTFIVILLSASFLI